MSDPNNPEKTDHLAEQPSRDMSKDFVIVETFAGRIIGTCDTLETAIATAQQINRREAGDSNYIIARRCGVVKLMKWREAPQPVDPRIEEMEQQQANLIVENNNLKSQLAQLNASIDKAQREVTPPTVVTKAK
jgi:hypothetical protein